MQRELAKVPIPLSLSNPDDIRLFRELDALADRETVEQREEREQEYGQVLDKRFAEIRKSPLTRRDPDTGKFPLMAVYGSDRVVPHGEALKYFGITTGSSRGPGRPRGSRNLTAK